MAKSCSIGTHHNARAQAQCKLHFIETGSYISSQHFPLMPGLYMSLEESTSCSLLLLDLTVWFYKSYWSNDPHIVIVNLYPISYNEEVKEETCKLKLQFDSSRFYSDQLWWAHPQIGYVITIVVLEWLIIALNYVPIGKNVNIFVYEGVLFSSGYVKL